MKLHPKHTADPDRTAICPISMLSLHISTAFPFTENRFRSDLNLHSMNEQVHFVLLQTTSLTLLRRLQNPARQWHGHSAAMRLPHRWPYPSTDSLLQDFIEKIQSIVNVEHHEHVMFSGGKNWRSKDQVLPEFPVPRCHFQLVCSFE